MSVFDAVKAVYACTGEKAVLYDKSFAPVWFNSNVDILDAFYEKLKYEDSLPPPLPIEKEIVCRHVNGSAVKITPLREDGGICGYLAVFYDPEDIQLLFCHSVKLNEQEAYIGNIRRGLSGLLLAADKLTLSSEYSEEQAIGDIHSAVLNTLSAGINQNIAARAYSDAVVFESLSLTKLTNTIISECSKLFESADSTLISGIAPGIRIKGSSFLIEASLLNLIINAFMYSNVPKKEITVSLSASDDKASLSVSDNGTSADSARIERASHYNSRSIVNRPGERLGLPLARRTAELHGGSIAFERSPSGGLTVTLTFPILSEEEGLALRSTKKLSPYLCFDHRTMILSKGMVISNCEIIEKNE